MRRTSACAASKRVSLCDHRRMCNCSYGIIKMNPHTAAASGLLCDVRRRGQTGAEPQRSGVIQSEARLDVVQERTAEAVEVLPQRCVVEGEDPAGVIQEHADLPRRHRDADVRRPAVVQELVFVPAGGEETDRSGSSLTPIMTLCIYINIKVPSYVFLKMM